MSFELILFIFFSLIASISSVVMITRPNPVMSAIYLIINLFSLAGLYLLLNAQFIAAAQVIVYAGAIMVLFLFVLMLLNTRNEILSFRNKFIHIPAVTLAVLIFIQIVYLVFFSADLNNLNSVEALRIQSGTVEQIGTELYSKYILPFEAAGFLLLAATIGALVLAKRKFE